MVAGPSQGQEVDEADPGGGNGEEGEGRQGGDEVAPLVIPPPRSGKSKTSNKSNKKTSIQGDGMPYTGESQGTAEQGAFESGLPEEKSAAAEAVPVDSSKSGKLRKQPPTFVEGDAPTNTPAGNAAPLQELEPVILPDGTTAYIRKPLPAETAPSIGSGKKGKSSNGLQQPLNENASIGNIPQLPQQLAESQLGHGHCSVCCPSAPRNREGVPVEACSHQDGVPVKENQSKKLKKTSVTSPAGPLDLPGEEVAAPIGTEAEIPASAKAPSSKGKSKKVQPEDEMDDVKRLAGEFLY